VSDIRGEAVVERKSWQKKEKLTDFLHFLDFLPPSVLSSS